MTQTPASQTPASQNPASQNPASQNPASTVPLQQRFDEQEQELRVHQAELEQQNEELRHTNLALELARQQYTDLFDFAPVGYVVCDEAGLTLQINQTGCAQLGAPAAHLVGRPLTLFVEPGRRSEFAELLCQAFAATPTALGLHRRELPMVRQNAERWDAQVEVTALAGLHGPAARIVLTDISALKTAQRESEQRSAQSQRLNDELQTFLHALTHDLTRPQRQVEGFAALLSRSLPSLDAQSARHLKNLLTATSDLGTLTTALTRFFQSGQPASTPQPVDLNQLVGSVFHELEPERRGRTVALTYDPLPTLDSDRQSLHMIFFNLLSNAVKFTRPRPEARIHVGVKLTDESYLLCVHDNGVGFDPAQAGRLFGLFERLHSEREFRGQGLSLALVRRIVERHQGRVWAESTPGNGATFWIQWPRTGSSAGSRTGSSAAAADGATLPTI